MSGLASVSLTEEATGFSPTMEAGLTTGLLLIASNYAGRRTSSWLVFRITTCVSVETLPQRDSLPWLSVTYAVPATTARPVEGLIEIMSTQHHQVECMMLPSVSNSVLIHMPQNLIILL